MKPRPDLPSGSPHSITRGWCIKSKSPGVDCEMNVSRTSSVGNTAKNTLFTFSDPCIIRPLNKSTKFASKNCCQGNLIGSYTAGINRLKALSFPYFSI